MNENLALYRGKAAVMSMFFYVQYVFCLPTGVCLISMDFWVAATNRRKLQVSIHFFYFNHPRVFNNDPAVYRETRLYTSESWT